MLGKGGTYCLEKTCEYLSLGQINEDITDLFLIAFRLLDRLKLLSGWCVRGDSVGVGRRFIMVAEYVHCIAF